jgi:hypothetical protein
MKLFLKKIFFFCSLLILSSYPISSFIESQYFTEHKQHWILSLHDYEKDYLVLGSSRSYYAIDVEYLDSLSSLNGFNIATAAGSYADNLILLQEYLAHNKPPKFILLNIDEYSLNATEGLGEKSFHYHEFLRLIKNPNYRSIMIDYVGIWKYLLNLWFPISKYVEFNHLLYIKPNKEIQNKLINWNKHQGFLASPAFTKSDIKLRESYTESQPKDIKYLKELLHFSNQKNIDVFLYTPPTYLNKPSEKHHLTHQNQFIQIAKNTNVNYLNVNDDFPSDSIYLFDDMIHLNQAGAKLYSNLLANRFMQLGYGTPKNKALQD